MCGLVLRVQAGPDPQGWSRAIDALACRGPDSRGEMAVAGCRAGLCRLEIIGLGDIGRQPYSEHPETDVLVYNGEIYNYAALGQRLGLAARSDTQVLYHLLRSGSLHLLQEVRGMYAFAYWDSRSHAVVVGRDPFGIKPLYASIGADGSLSVASVVAALAPIVDAREPDAEAIAGFLATGYFPAGTSAVAGIVKLPEGRVTTYTRHGAGWAESSIDVTGTSWPQLPVAEAVADSVDAHLVSDVPVGVLLSGGVDSTLIAALAARRVDGLRTYSLVNPGSPDLDESGYARWNAALIGAEHAEVPFDPDDALDLARAIVASSGEPFGDAAYLPLAVLCRRVAADVKVVLAGEGADELFGGYRRYDAERMRRGRLTGGSLRVLSRSARGPARYESLRPSTAARSWAHWGTRDDYLAYCYLLSGEWQVVAATLPEAGSRALARERSAWQEMPATATRGLPAHLAFDLGRWLPNVFLEKSDRASMLAGVEVRVPYLDPVVARAARAFLPRDTRKAPLRQALHGLLPDARLPGRKMGLGVDIERLMRGPGLGDYAASAMHDPDSVLRRIGLVRPGSLARRAGLNPALAFRLGMLGLWQATVLDAPA
ncbi:MAG: asparagine synthase (glutamine-hydrolyzing) [Candidatus Nanopelagicales bacterium]